MKLADITDDFTQLAAPVLLHPRVRSMDQFIQHGATTTLDHCMAVAYYSLLFVRTLKISCNEQDLVTAALLHDYYLYDWHIKDACPEGLHGFSHPRLALRNAMADFELSERVQNAIKRHMFPLTPIPPKYREGIIVCLIDKVCSTYEVFVKEPWAWARLKELEAYL